MDMSVHVISCPIVNHIMYFDGGWSLNKAACAWAQIHLMKSLKSSHVNHCAADFMTRHLIRRFVFRNTWACDCWTWPCKTFSMYRYIIELHYALYTADFMTSSWSVRGHIHRRVAIIMLHFISSKSLWDIVFTHVTTMYDLSLFP